MADFSYFLLSSFFLFPLWINENWKLSIEHWAGEQVNRKHIDEKKSSTSFVCLEYHHESLMFEHIWLVLLDYQLHPHLELELCEIFHEDCGLLEWLGLGFEDLAPSLSSFNFRKVQIWPRIFPLCTGYWNRWWNTSAGAGYWNTSTGAGYWNTSTGVDAGRAEEMAWFIGHWSWTLEHLP